MPNELAASIAALGIALAPALLKFAEVSKTEADVAVDADASVECVAEDDAPVHARYLSTGTAARLPLGSVVQVVSKRKEWRHVAYVLDGAAELGWITTQYLEACAGSGEPAKDDGDDDPPASRPKKRSSRGAADTELDGSPHAMLGVPSDDDPSDDLLMDHGIYVLSYNDERRQPNWVAWKLKGADLGDEDRMNDFRADDELPEGFLRLSGNDYAKTGFERGHLCPSAHRTSTADDNSLTFLMSNMQPQRPSLNKGPWKSLETYERNLVDREGKEIYVVAGGVFSKNPQPIGTDGIAVPKKSFRVTVVLDAKQSLKAVNETTPIYAVAMPNEDSVRGHKWFEFMVPIDKLEQETGYDFLSALADGLEDKVEKSAAAAPE